MKDFWTLVILLIVLTIGVFILFSNYRTVPTDIFPKPIEDVMHASTTPHIE